MAGLKEEYFMWDQRFQLGYNCLDRRLQDTNERAMQQIAQLNEQNKQLAAITKQVQEDNSSLRDRIQQLEQTSSRMPKFDNQIQDLAASTKQLQKNNSSLRDRIQQLEQTSPGILQLEQTSTRITQLDEQIQDLAASSSDLKEQSNDSNYRILQIEQEGTHRDQENQLVQEQLKEKLDALKGNVEGVVAAMNGMNEMAGLDRAQRVKEIQHLKSQIENIIAAWHTTGGYARDASTDISRPTTEDERIQVDNHAEQQQAAQEFEAQGVLIKAQTSSTLFEDHWRYVEKAFKQWETEAVLAFVSSVHKKYRSTLEDRLEKHGEWTWQAATEEAYEMVEAERNVKRRSARLIAGPSKLT